MATESRNKFNYAAKQPASPTVAGKDSGLQKAEASEFPLGRKNFRWMIVSAILIVAGFLLMLGSGSSEEFNPDIFSVRRIVIGPTIAFVGFVAMCVSIVVRPGK